MSAMLIALEKGANERMSAYFDWVSIRLRRDLSDVVGAVRND